MGSFDEYVKQHNVKPEDYPAAFAAYLHEISAGEWDGDYEDVSGDGEDA